MSEQSDHLNSLIKEHNGLAKQDGPEGLQEKRSPRQNEIRQELVKMMSKRSLAASQ